MCHRGGAKKEEELKNYHICIYKQVTLHEAKAQIPTWNSTSQVDGKKTSYQNQLTKSGKEEDYTEDTNIKGGGADNLSTTHNPVGSLLRKSHNSDIKAGKPCHP